MTANDAAVEAARQEERLKLACEIDDLLKVKWDNIRAMEIAETVLFYLREQGWMNPLEITAHTEAAVKERETGILRAYHVTLDSLGAPADEWPCNRVAVLVRDLTARLAAAIKEWQEEAAELNARLARAEGERNNYRESVKNLAVVGQDLTRERDALKAERDGYENLKNLYADRMCERAQTIVDLKAAVEDNQKEITRVATERDELQRAAR